LRDLDVDSLGFLDVMDNAEGAVGASLAWSGLLGGEIRLPAVNRSMRLEAGDWLRIGGGRLRLTSLALGDSALSIGFRGTVGTLDLASSGVRRSLKPTRLELLTERLSKTVIAVWVIVGSLVLVLLRVVSVTWGRP